ncbi:glycosyltransferase family 4 protein [Devosia ginsengisoli]|uniref:MraY family glycosyltransferase n=1 Tax=Devosia ginsengisoli TaxID=400770 RepID=UPI0026F2C761|nr:glycosyltransferase family 4 protein [Devosia ginsengisoli]MCR6672064.1 glycosyltransferase family 4 protein [Devosia ginsengisoli]
MIFLMVLVSAAISAATALALIRRAASLGLLQQANERSSHVAPTPTGGGVGIALGTVFGILLIGAASDFDTLTMVVLAAAIAVLGLADDRWSLPATLRLLVQLILVSILVIALTSPWQTGNVMGAVLMAALLIVAGVWWVNLYNFMDGIDGFAGAQAVFMLAAALLLAAQAANQPWTHALGLLALSAIAATLAFLALNWPPAKIFMGDVGSTFLGFLILAIAIATSKLGWLSLWQWSILGVAFAADATVTLLRRFRDGKNVFQAHRSHTYQRVSRLLGGHRTVTLGLIAANIVLVLPAAWLAGQWPDHAWIIAAGTYMLAGIAALRLGAGRPDAA